MNYAIIGCGLIGKKRAASLPPAFARHYLTARKQPVRAGELTLFRGNGTSAEGMAQAALLPRFFSRCQREISLYGHDDY